METGSDEYIKKRKRLYKVPFIVSVTVLTLFFVVMFMDPSIGVLIGTAVIFMVIYKVFINFPISIFYLRKIRKNMDTDYYSKIKAHYRDIFNIVLVPAYLEEKEALYEQKIASVRKSRISDTIAVVFVLEQNDEKAQDILKKLQKRYNNVFMIAHPPEEGVVRGKSSAMAYAGKLIGAVRYGRDFSLPDKASETTREYTMQFMEKLSPLVSGKEVVIHDTDIDFWFPRVYFEYFVHRYLNQKNRKNAIFQPIVTLINNIDKVNFFSRNIALSTTYEALMGNYISIIKSNFSSYAISLDTLDKIGYWRADVIQEDSSLYWRVRTSLGRKNVKIVPLAMPIFGNAIEGETWVKEFDSQWKQLERWGIGTSDFADIWLSDTSLMEKLSSIPWWIKYHVLWETTGIIGLTTMLVSSNIGYSPLPSMFFFLSYILTFIGMTITNDAFLKMSLMEREVIFENEDEFIFVESIQPPSTGATTYLGQFENRFPTAVFSGSTVTATAFLIITESSKRAIFWMDVGYIAALSISSICALQGAYRAFKYDLKYVVAPK